MANLSLVQKAELRDRKVEAKRMLAEDIGHFLQSSVRVYSPHDVETFLFTEYFYPWEQFYIETNNFEKYSGRTKKSSKCFRNAKDLEEYTREMSDPSSNNEDRPPASEELFYDSNLEHLYDAVLKHTAYTPRLTLLQCSLLRDLSTYILDPEHDLPERAKRIIERRLDLIRGYCKELKRKRYAKAYRRFTRVRSKQLPLPDEAMELLVDELLDKDLGRAHYYDADEPKELADILLESRRQAIKRKYLQYATDARFRRAYRNKIYYNVNKDVPSGDTMHMNENRTTVYQKLYPSARTVPIPQMTNCVRMRGGASPNVLPKSTKQIFSTMEYKVPNANIMVDLNYAPKEINLDVARAPPISSRFAADTLKNATRTSHRSYYKSPAGGIVSVTMNTKAPQLDPDSSLRPMSIGARETQFLNVPQPNAVNNQEQFFDIFDPNLSNQLDDSDIPTSEAELMPQYGTKISKRMRTRRTRLLKALHRLLYVENMNLSPEEMAKRLCAIELESKGLYLTDGDANARLVREQRRQAVKDKWKKFATDAQYREDYITRLHSVKTIAPVSGTAARTKPTDDRPKAVLVHHVPRKSATPPAGEYPGSTNYFTNRPSRSFNETPTDTRHDGADQNFTTTPNQSEWNYTIPEEPSGDSMSPPRLTKKTLADPKWMENMEQMIGPTPRREVIQQSTNSGTPVNPFDNAADFKDIYARPSSAQEEAEVGEDDDNEETLEQSEEENREAESEDIEETSNNEESVDEDEIDPRPLHEITLNPATLQPHTTPKKVREERMKRQEAQYFHTLKHNKGVLDNWLPYDSSPPKQGVVKKQIMTATSTTSIISSLSVQRK